MTNKKINFKYRAEHRLGMMSLKMVLTANETEKMVLLIHDEGIKPRREMKQSKTHCYFDDWCEARNWLLKRADLELKLALLRRDKAIKLYSDVLALRSPFIADDHCPEY